MTERHVAFQWIDRQQEWTNKKKSAARYKWKKLHAPDTIRRRNTTQITTSPQHDECPICFEKSEMPTNDGKCQHFKTICMKCIEKLTECPFCRTQWKPQNRSRTYNPNIIREHVEEGTQTIHQLQNSMDTLTLVWSRVQDDLTSGFYTRRRRNYLPRAENDLLELIADLVFLIHDTNQLQLDERLGRGH